MSKRTIREMLGNLPVGMVDVVRLFVESVEEAGLEGTERAELIAGFRKVVRAGVVAVKDAERTLPFGEVVQRSLEARAGRRKSTLADLRSYMGRMVRYGDWAEKPLRGIHPDECRELLQAVFGHSPHVFRKARAVLHSLFAYGMRQGWCEGNPVEGIEVPRVVENRVEPLSLREVNRLMKACREPDMQDMAPAVSLMLWCGVRPGEVQRLTWDDVDAGEGVVYIPPQHSKTGGARLVPLRGAAAANFPHHPSPIAERTSPIAPRNWAKRWRDLRRRAGLFHWQQDALRHTFASMHMRCFANPPQLQAEMGHRDSSLLRTRYVNLRGITRESVKLFWKMTK